MTTNNKENKTFGQKVGNFFRVILRLTFTIVLAVGVGVSLYYGIAYGIPAFQNKYIQPVTDNSQRLDNLEIRQAQQQEQLVERIKALRERIETLEIQNDTDKEVFTELQSQIDELSGQVFSGQATVQAYEGYTEELKADLQNAIATIEAQQAQLQDEFNSLAAEQIPVTDLQNELTLVKIMTLLTRAQQSLLHSNFGLAKNDLLAAQELLYDFQDEDTETQIEEVIQHLEAATDQLPENPDLAANELEIAWILLVSEEDEIAEEAPQVTPTGTPTPTSEEG